MQAQTNVFPVQSQLVRQTQVIGQTRVAPLQTTGNDKYVVTTTMGVIELILRMICAVSHICDCLCKNPPC